jgi:hypothetical protein
MQRGIVQGVRRLVDEYRATCLWFLREDYYRETLGERERILGLIGQHGDLQTFRRVARMLMALTGRGGRI